MGVPNDRVDCKAENKSRPSHNGRLLDRYFSGTNNIYFFFCHSSVILWSIKTFPTQGQIEKSRKGEREALASHKGPVYFTEKSLKIIQNFTEEGDVCK